MTAPGELPGPTPERFMESHRLTFPVALDATDGRLADAFGLQGYPTIYYVGSDGTVSQVTVGATPEAEVRSAIEAIAAPGPSMPSGCAAVVGRRASPDTDLAEPLGGVLGLGSAFAPIPGATKQRGRHALMIAVWIVIGIVVVVSCSCSLLRGLRLIGPNQVGILTKKMFGKRCPKGRSSRATGRSAFRRGP